MKPPTLRPLGMPTRQQSKKIADRIYNQKRAGDPTNALYKTARWRIERMHFLAEHPLCECSECQGGKLRVTAANEVNHRIAHRGDEALFWDQSNWQAMSSSHHSRHTARHDGGFGNARKPTADSKKISGA